MHLVTRMIKKIIITFVLLIAIFQIDLINIKATDNNVTSCDISVDLLTVGKRSYTDIRTNTQRTENYIIYNNNGCYTSNQWYEAKAQFNQLKSEGKKDIVIRYHKTDDVTFQSPLKVIYADRAMAYTQNYAYTVGNITKNDFGVDVAKTISIYNDVTLQSKYTSLDDKEPLYYYETNKIIENNSSKPSNMAAYVEVNGAKGYIKLTGIDLIPLIYAENNAIAPFYVKLGNAGEKSLYVRSDGRSGIIPELTKYHVINGELQIDIDRATSAGTSTYAKAPSWLPNGTYYSPNGINFYSDPDLKIPMLDNGQIGNFYNYFSYLNLRSKTKYTAQEIDSYLAYYDANNSFDYSISKMKDQAATFISSQNTYGMNALLIYAFGIHESSYGTSAIALAKNNLFGYGASTSNPSDAFSYASIEESVKIHMGRQMRYYLDYSNSNLFYGSNFGNKGIGANTRYADDPFWSTKIAGHAYRIDRYLGFKDYNAYQIGILDPNVSNTIYQDRDLSTPLYSIMDRAKNYPFTINTIYNNVYYIQSTNPISPTTYTLITTSTTGEIPYDFDISKAYIASNQVKLVNTPLSPVLNLTPLPPKEIDTTLNLITHLNWNGDLLEIKGASALKNTNMGLNITTHTLSIISNFDSSIVFNYTLESDTPMYPINLNNGFDYTSAWFKGTIDIKDIPDGFYKFVITTKSGITSGTFDMINTPTTPMPTMKTIGDYDYKFVFNNFKRMSYELIKEKGILTDQQSPTLFSRFPSFSMITEFNIAESDNKKLLNISGAALMQHVNQGPNDNVTHKLMLVDSNGNQNIYDLNTINGTSSMITDKNFNYTSSSFTGQNIDISSLEPGNYRTYVIVQNTNYTDVVELKNNAFLKENSFETIDKTYSLKINNILRKRFELDIIEKVDNIDTTTP